MRSLFGANHTLFRQSLELLQVHRQLNFGVVRANGVDGLDLVQDHDMVLRSIDLLCHG